MLCEKAHKPNTEQFFETCTEDDDSATIEVNADRLDQLGHLQATYGEHLN